jgi:hypothetical protein
MKNTLLILIFGFLSQMAFSQNVVSPENGGIKYYNQNFFLIEGTTFTDSVKENLYDRLPLSYKGKVRDAVWSLSKSSAGISVRFLSNSTTIRVKWELLNDAKMNHMAETGIKGVDLYFKNNGIWQYVNTARPAGKSNDYLLVGNMTPSMREYRMNLPLYDGVTKLEIGIDSLSNIVKPERTNKKPIVFYGTSITQGGCASRPGMVHTSIISRKLDVECINFGFSGNGRMEKPLAELISGIDALFYVLDGTNNMTPEQIHENAIPLVEIIRSKHPATPIIFVEGLLNDRSYLDKTTRDVELAKNEMLKKEFQEMIKRGFKNIYYIGQAGGKGIDYESTVDGVHLTDLGFSRYADFLLREFRRIKVIDRKWGR